MAGHQRPARQITTVFLTVSQVSNIIHCFFINVAFPLLFCFIAARQFRAYEGYTFDLNWTSKRFIHTAFYNYYSELIVQWLPIPHHIHYQQLSNPLKYSSSSETGIFSIQREYIRLEYCTQILNHMLNVNHVSAKFHHSIWFYICFTQYSTVN